MSKYPYLDSTAPLTPILKDANHVDVKTVVSTVSLREFVAAMLNHQPAWISFLYRVRGSFVRVLGLRQTGVPRPTGLRPESVPMVVGAKAAFFRVCLAEEDHYWLADVNDTHLSAVLGVVAEPLDEHRKRFYVLTVVHYHNWAGPLYFNIIRPFHHLVVSSMLKVGSRGDYAVAG